MKTIEYVKCPCCDGLGLYAKPAEDSMAIPKFVDFLFCFGCSMKTLFPSGKMPVVVEPH